MEVLVVVRVQAGSVDQTLEELRALPRVEAARAAGPGVLVVRVRAPTLAAARRFIRSELRVAHGVRSVEEVENLADHPAEVREAVGSLLALMV